MLYFHANTKVSRFQMFRATVTQSIIKQLPAWEVFKFCKQSGKTHWYGNAILLYVMFCQYGVKERNSLSWSMGKKGKVWLEDEQVLRGRRISPGQRALTTNCTVTYGQKPTTFNTTQVHLDFVGGLVWGFFFFFFSMCHFQIMIR